MENSTLIRLPAELRNTIYELVLLEDEVIILRHNNGSLKRWLPFTGAKCVDERHKNILALTRTCKQLRNETHPLVFSLNEFFVRGWWFDGDGKTHYSLIDDCRRWLEIIGLQNAKLIKRLLIEGPHVKFSQHASEAKTLASGRIINAATTPGLDRAYIRITGDYGALPPWFWNTECSVTGEKHSRAFGNVSLSLPLFDKALAGTMVDNTFAERDAMIREHETHSCWVAAASQEKLLLQHLSGARVELLRVVDGF